MSHHALLLSDPYCNFFILQFHFSLNNTNNITYEGSARFANNSIQLTSSVPNTVARATYAQPLYLWDRASGNLTDFTMHFSFVIDSSNRTNYGDGFTFLLIPQGSPFYAHATGGSIGLTGLLWNSTEIRLVAVEFDIFSNEYVDPPYEHIGININAVSSVNSTEWLGANRSIMAGRPQEAWISYDSQSRNLSVVFAGFRNGTSITQSLSHKVDLKEELPEYVSVGFTASTGGVPVVQNINSWSFSSNIQAANVNETNSTGPNGNGREFRRPNNETGSGSRHTAMVIGSAVGGLVLLLAIAF